MTPHLPDPMARTRARMQDVFTPNQVLGRVQTIGCVAVEITQRCNLDCTLCYLSEHSQAVKDIPLVEVYRRLDEVLVHYGAGTHVQITGGDPTLRKHTELVKIVAYASDLGLYPALFTNGIAASRRLLTRLAEAGLRDVAFHVDTTQRREGFPDELSLNPIREDYLNRARGLGLTVMFNTTVHKDNFADIPRVVEFMTRHADVIGLCSFQMQADTGRGEWGSRDTVITQQTVQRQIERGAAQSLPWDVIQVGHRSCHNYLPTLVINGRVFPIVDDNAFFADFLRDFAKANWNRHDASGRIAVDFLKIAAVKPRWWPRLIRTGFNYARRLGPAWLRARGQAHKLTFFVQNFMDAGQLDKDRVNACSFMVMTAQGPVSMCEHNAHRDDYILQPLTLQSRTGEVIHYEPLKATSSAKTGQLSSDSWTPSTDGLQQTPEHDAAQDAASDAQIIPLHPVTD